MTVLRIESQGRLLRLRFLHSPSASGGGDPARIDSAHTASERAWDYVWSRASWRSGGSGYSVPGDIHAAVLGAADAAAITAYRDRLHTSSGRRPVSSFSRASRKRLLETAARIDWSRFHDVKLVTLTYRRAPAPARAKYHLKKLLLWLRRRASSFWAIWRMEFQRRGAVHFHLVLADAGWLDLPSLSAYWQAMTGDDSYPDVKAVRLSDPSDVARRVVGYIAKYVAKDSKDLDGLDCLSKKNLALRPVRRFLPVMVWTAAPARFRWLGRFWGVAGRRHVPWAEVHTVDISAAHPWSYRFAVHASRFARRLLSARRVRYAPDVGRGFTLFIDRPSRPVLYWFNLASADVGYPDPLDLSLQV